jgi:hypothetical protein
MSSDILKYLSNKVQAEISIIEHDMALGSAKDYGDYKYACGIARGLRMVASILQETHDRMETDND